MKKIIQYLFVSLLIFSVGSVLGMHRRLISSFSKTARALKSGSLLPVSGKQQRNFSHAFYKLTDDHKIEPLNEAEYKSVYPLWTQYAFPMNSHPAWEHDKNLSPEAKLKMHEDDQMLLQEKISQINPSFRVAWVPSLVHDALACKKSQEQGDSEHVVYGLDAYDITEKNELKRYYADFEQSHYRMNEYMVKNISKDPVGSKGLTEGNIVPSVAHKIVDMCYNYIPNFRRPAYCKFGDARDEKEDAAILHSSLDAEFQACKEGDVILYRGTDGNDAPVVKNSWWKKATPHSLSFGASVLGGCRNDLMATAYQYMQNKAQAYGVRINKRDYLNKGEAYNYFYIPALTGYMALNGRGDLFHPRSRTFRAAVSGLHSHLEIDQPFIKKELWVGKNSTVRESVFNKEFMNYVSKNSTYFKQ
jgi:hypothetical protein